MVGSECVCSAFGALDVVDVVHELEGVCSLLVIPSMEWLLLGCGGGYCRASAFLGW